MVRCSVHHLGIRRKRLVDIDDPMPCPEDALTRGVVTVLWPEDGGVSIRCDLRCGSKRMPMLKSYWTGYAIFYELCG